MHPNHTCKSIQAAIPLLHTSIEGFLANYTVNGNQVLHATPTSRNRSYISQLHFQSTKSELQAVLPFTTPKIPSMGQLHILLLANRECNREGNVDSYKEFLRTPEGQTNIPTISEDLEKTQQSNWCSKCWWRLGGCSMWGRLDGSVSTETFLQFQTGPVMLTGHSKVEHYHQLLS